MRLLFTMYAEDVPVGGFELRDFQNELKELRKRGGIEDFVPLVENLWATMDEGGYSGILKKHIKQFNGGLFEDRTALPLNEDQLDLLIEASEMRWTNVEPAIFGTLLERALDPVERHKLGAHYTPRAYVERLVMPTIIEPLRTEWENVYATALAEFEEGESIIEALDPAVIRHGKDQKLKDGRKLKRDAVKQVRDFHNYLCNIIVLDPACGSGNFLYVSMELMKRLEGEVLNVLRDFGETERRTITVDPHQFKGIEVNERAAVIADLVLWIGYLQWFVRTHDSDPPEPIIKKGKDYKNIECRDAVLSWDSIEEVFDEEGKPVTRWDGRTTKTHPVTGEEVPDETARVQELRYINPHKAEWPKASYVVGNPPFLGKLHQVKSLGEGYVAALRDTYVNSVPGGADYVMYWWQIASELVGNKEVSQFGLITTNSIRQPFNRRILANAFQGKKRIHLIYAIPDHPWVDASLGAAVRIAMTVGASGSGQGVLYQIDNESLTTDGSSELQLSSDSGEISETLRIGAQVASVHDLRANVSVASMGPALGSRGFVVDKNTRDALVQSDGVEVSTHIRPLRNGRDLLDGPRGVFALDFTGFDETQLRTKYKATYQHLLDNVRPGRMQNRDRRLRKNWWLFRRSNELFRSMLNGLDQFIVTVETAKYRLFFICEGGILAEHGTISFGLDDPYYYLGVLSKRVHVVWSLVSGGTLEDRPRYNKTLCFEPFPFPNPSDSQKVHIRMLAEQLEAHRKTRQELHPKLSMTDMYNVLEALRSGDELSDKEKAIHEQGQVSVLNQLHDDLDAAVFDAYGWPQDLTDEEILQRLVDLNHERPKKKSEA